MFKNQELKPKICATCGQEFQPTSARSKYCSPECKMGTATCIRCGKEFVRKGNTTGRYCSQECWYSDPTKGKYGATNCPICGKEFHREREDHMYCSEVCRYEGLKKPREARQCLECGTQLPDGTAKRSQKFCSKSCAVKYNNARRIGFEEKELGAKQRAPHGYTIIKVGRGYPGALSTGWILEHRKVIAEKIGRPLTSSEHVHHKNGNRSDNRPENLELWVGTKDPSGQRFWDRAQEFLDQPEIRALSPGIQEILEGVLLRLGGL